ncbi:hypothetical protein KI387_013161 [Taxus chinensis]|uniref:HAUS augmin-like complex subunit 6 N-terminal domain-containing protein n=1 Tax=Taxus chinensis TaxID=29808 RepID=A0AA38CS06_TAXCH|nr:hypothetical protein KI387_013161 [Taxus chinensis]
MKRELMAYLVMSSCSPRADLPTRSTVEGWKGGNETLENAGCTESLKRRIHNAWQTDMSSSTQCMADEQEFEAVLCTVAEIKMFQRNQVAGIWLEQKSKYFNLCSWNIDGASKDFAGVWPIFDAAQSRDFRKIVQGLINELESQGALPRSNSRVSSLATCCGQRFVELLWQLSTYALREVHKRAFIADVAANPLPASLTEVVNQSSHASTLLAVTKARIALERRRFLEGAATAVRRQVLWSSLAHDMTAEFRGLCAEEAYLQQELEKVQDLKNSKAKFDEDIKDRSGSGDHRTLSVSRASRLWDSLMNHTAQHEELASGPIEDLIAHREHRYRISGSTLRAALECSSNLELLDCLSSKSEDPRQREMLEEEIHTGCFQNTVSERQNQSVQQTETQGSEESFARIDERCGKASPAVDVAEILRRWTHALQRIHKQSLRLARSNDGAGPELLKNTSESGENGHAESLQATLAEHRQHLANIQVLIGQLKDARPAMEASISTLREEVSKAVACAPTMRQKSSLGSPHKSEKEVKTERNGDVNSKAIPAQLELVPPIPALKLPQLFSLSPNPPSKANYLQKHQVITSQMNTLEVLSECDKVNGLSPTPSLRNEEFRDDQKCEHSFLRQSVREAALSKPTINSEPLRESVDQNIEHYFIPLSATSNFAKGGDDMNCTRFQSKLRVFRSLEDSYKSSNNSIADKDKMGKQFDRNSALHNLHTSKKHVSNGHLSTSRSESAGSEMQEDYMSELEAEKAGGELVQPLSPPLLMELSSFPEAYDDLLAPMSEGDAALMECSMQTMHS